MPLELVKPGNNIPDDFNVIIEIPAQSFPVKYEIDKDSATLSVDRFMGTAMQYPTNYGYIPQTLSGDGDPVDVLVITPVPLLARCVVRCRSVGLLDMTDEAGKDPKILAVPIVSLTSYYNQVNDFHDLPRASLDTISHFFEHYKDLEEGKWVRIDGWLGREHAVEEINSSISAYNQQNKYLQQDTTVVTQSEQLENMKV
ncbi:MAG TPA: inorganic diphosphatase [Methylococcaceae bacterium]|jgi:inorganic pyrophosphatase|nr:inorganic diphosphatase [Methylococcaceae bacterium]HIA45175.1 inorganic diphosphatase [Methylococcaceae bacterium]HIN68134.1 inorganic diphosphatase [Methylococcales bacterium]HIO45484.1 inorganic diphosphatase [Methylococcales bacterium]